MKTINANSNGTQFIQDLNDNFAECMTGGVDGNISVNIPLQGGELKSSTGYVDGRWCTNVSNGAGTWTDDNFYKYLHTPCYLSIRNNSIKSITVPSGSTLSIFCYDAELALINNGVVSSTNDIPSGTSYVKLMLYNANGYSQTISISVTLASHPEWVKNTGTAYTAQFFNYDCKPPELWDDSGCTTPHESPTDGDADVDNTRYHDNGCIILPPNYSPTGKPCRLVLWFNGDNTSVFTSHDCFHKANGDVSVYDNNYKFLSASGYAVAMCSGYTSMWKNEMGANDSSKWVARISPAYIASSKALYDYLMCNYNLEPEVYLAAKSAGGSMLLYTALARPFPVRAAAGISVIVSVFDTMRYSLAITQKTWQKRFGCSNWNSFVLSSSGSGATATLVHNGSGASTNQINDSNRLIANKDIIRKYDAFGMNSNIDWDAFVTQCLLLNTPFNDGVDFPSALTDIILNSVKICLTPIKYWCATKDAAVPYTWHKIMVDWLKKNGCIAELRSYTGSDGGHATFCGANNKTATVETKYGGTRTAGIGIIEAVEWFERY